MIGPERQVRRALPRGRRPRCPFPTGLRRVAAVAVAVAVGPTRQTTSLPKARSTSPSEDAILRAIGRRHRHMGHGVCHDAAIRQHRPLPNPRSSLALQR